MSLKRKHSSSPSPSPSSQDIYQSTRIHDRSSTFIAYYSPTLAPRTLQSHPDLSSASHRILAWRSPSAQLTLGSGKQLYKTGHDDDGEKYAGKRVAGVLDALGAEGVVVVARWYGGVMLGPVRFTHIETVAREAVGVWKETLRSGPVGVKRKIEEDDQNDRKGKERLVRVLGERDGSIVVLRGLLAEKEANGVELAVGGGGGSGGSSQASAAASPAKGMHYEGMEVSKLRQLERARDATIGFLLKQIDKAEEKQKKSLEKVRTESARPNVLPSREWQAEEKEALSLLADALLAEEEAEDSLANAPASSGPGADRLDREDRGSSPDGNEDEHG